MKKKINNIFKKISKKKLIIIIIIIALILVLVGISLFGPQNEEVEENKTINDSGVYVEEPGTVTISNDDLSSNHCIDDICLSNVKIYYVDTQGRVDFTITNYSKKTVTGYLRLKFGNESLVIPYNKLKSNKSVNSSTMFIAKDLSQAVDYTIEKLTDEEISKIIK
jgi:hypothetical protein